MVNTEKQKNALSEKIRRYGFVPDPQNPGYFLKPQKANPENPTQFLYPENWVFHSDIVQKVLEGKYEEIRPYSAEFVTTLNCTNRCLGPCSYSLQRMNEGVESKNDFKNPRAHMQSLNDGIGLMDKLIDGGIRGLIFTGGGEPALCTDLEDLMAHANKRKIDTVLYSNGNSWSKDRIRHVCETNPLLVRISLNCGTKDSYNSFHNPRNKDNAFPNVLSAIGSFAKESRNNPNMDFGVSFIMNEVNYLDLPQTSKRIIEILDESQGRISFVTYRPAFNYHGPVQTNAKIAQDSYDIVENSVRPELEKAGVRVLNVKCRYDALQGEERGYSICRASGLFAELGPSKELHSCCDRNCFKAFAIGDLSKNSLEEIYSGEQRKMVLGYANKYACATCPPVCKPHETNKQFEKIEKLRVNGQIYRLELWLEAYKNKTPPKMVNF